ncbi:MAG: hypothetical protein Aurels2KO_24230 [Aureliella sp.]
MQAPTQERRFQQIALACVAVGSSIGAGATAFVWVARGELQTTTLLASLAALGAAIPVWHQLRSSAGRA